jgi:FlaA1/EpsC-like NDP-sugar epimerase
LISTDKAVDPQIIMGVSKRLAELVLLMPRSQSRAGSIRVGNVLGSEGSLAPLFLEQIARGWPFTVTDPDVERDPLTMDETVYRVLSAAATCPGDGVIAIPVLGDPVKIADLARYLIEQASARDVASSFTRLRPGDKLQEAFVSSCESNGLSSIDGTHWIDSPRLPDAELAIGLAELSAAIDTLDLVKHSSTLTRLVPEYEPSPLLFQQTPISQLEQ